MLSLMTESVQTKKIPKEDVNHLNQTKNNYEDYYEAIIKQ